MSDPQSLASRVTAYFENVERTVFRGDPACNPKLKVEVFDTQLVEDTITMVVVTPWTLNGMAFVPDDVFPDHLTLGKKRCPVFHNELEEIGAYFSINLLGDVGNLQSPDAARGVGKSLGQLFRAAVSQVRQEQVIADPSRRDLLRGRGA